jgi:hypothetical protein
MMQAFCDDRSLLSQFPVLYASSCIVHCGIVIADQNTICFGQKNPLKTKTAASGANLFFRLLRHTGTYKQPLNRPDSRGEDFRRTG